MASFLADRESLQPAKAKTHRKRHREHGSDTVEDASTSIDSGDTATTSCSEYESKAKKPKSESVEVKTGPAEPDKWTEELTLKLLGNIKASLPKDDRMKPERQAERLNWEKTLLNDFTAKECKEKWLSVVQNLRKYRTMTELVVDGFDWAKNPYAGRNLSKHPEMPRKPLTPYFQYYMAKRLKYHGKHPGICGPDVSKHLAKQFNELGDNKKQRYQDRYAGELVHYREEMVVFRSNHPELYANGSSRIRSSSRKSDSKRRVTPLQMPKLPTPSSLYMNDQITKIMQEDPEIKRKMAFEESRKKWQKLKDSRKLKWIMKAIQQNETYEKQMEEFIQQRPDSEQKSTKRLLTIAEQKIKDKHDGKPTKPPVNGYGLFTTQQLSQMTDVPSIERMAEVSRLWKEMNDGMKESYNKAAEESVRQYKEDLSAYLNSLPEEKRQQLKAEMEKKGKDKKTTAAVATYTPAQPVEPQRPQKPISAIFMYIEENKDKYRRKHPLLSEQEITRSLVKKYGGLSDDKAAKYRKAEQHAKFEYQKRVQEYVQEKPMTKCPKSFPGEPKRPPGSGYGLFSAEMLVKLTHIPSKERMTELSQRWRLLTANEKKEYTKRKEKLAKQYEKDLQKFRSTLSEEQRTQFQFVIDGRKGKKPAKSKLCAIGNGTPSLKGKKLENVPANDVSSDEDDEDETSPIAMATPSNMVDSLIVKPEIDDDSSSSSSGSDDGDSSSSSSSSSSSGSDSSSDDDDSSDSDN